MNIALLGYGKMGKMIEQIALSRNHTITARIDSEFSVEDLKDTDVAIDFSIPSAAFKNITTCLENDIPVISGTTGWLDRYDEAVELCNRRKGALIYASNFSLGVNIFFQLNEYLAKMMANLGEYDISLEEIHHTQKLDAPSGTAITLAEGIIKNSSRTGWKLDNAGENEIPITAKRIENVPGTHSIRYSGNVDDIEITHTAHSREGFALGAVIAAEWIVGKTGVFSMKDVLNLG
ncbi:4-hydroxy-tetrahydrodipicolinate reductase [Sinomicrobium weinanense]|uniref:4-hydroxy-tetrahydrodipicolinate reductase n=1 Tax=Sinomicrobium weinanense TaxID=2842200 RepID=A0A926JRN9_9FLAO|nr:4-hydroxy-tetrahydrodipicolinate reductase [Sinomicrobium weinanense]MBC9796064.1 4-hydroxy-tetrahydrodipicolinate reductase [Sinomicrobium weinanense]MBU3123117.1 4-hydroxy-tetrahydrodipicolinate reductase [Sinomicrobium weinanense]